MENLTNIALKLIDRFPTWYLMIIITMIIIYRMMKETCKNNSKLIVKLLSKWEIRHNKRIDKIKNELDEIKTEMDAVNEKIKTNTYDIDGIYKLLKNKE